MNQEKIGGFLKELRKQKGLTQQQIAEKFNVSNRTISRWENGNYMPELAIIPGLAELLGVSVNELMAGERFAKDEYKREADEQLLKTLRLIEEIREIKNSRWLSQGLGSTALAMFVSMVISWLFGSLWELPKGQELVGGIMLGSILVMLSGVWGVMYLGKGRLLVFFGAVMFFYCFMVDYVVAMALFVFVIPMGVVSVIGDRLYFQAIDKLLADTQPLEDLHKDELTKEKAEANGREAS